jgi:hypothetical protein
LEKRLEEEEKKRCAFNGAAVVFSFARKTKEGKPYLSQNINWKIYIS